MTHPNIETNLVDRLLNSFCELERAIGKARRALNEKPYVPQNIFERLNSYDSILATQRSLATELNDLIQTGDLDQIMHQVNVINALSGMIIDDAHAILTAIGDSPEKSGETESPEEFHFC